MSLYTYGNYIDEVLYSYTMSFGQYYYVQDHLYSPAALLDTSTPVPPRTLAKSFGFLLLFLFTAGFKKALSHDDAADRTLSFADARIELRSAL